MKKKAVYFLAVIMIMNTIIKPVHAAPTADQVENQKQQLQIQKEQLQNSQDKVFDIEQKIEELDNQIEDAMDEIEKNKNNIKQIQQEVKASEKEISNSQLEMAKEKVLYNERLRTLYINGTCGYLEVLLEADGLSDFLARVEVMKIIVKQDKKITATIKSKQENLNKQKETLNTQNNRLLALNDENTKKMDKLKSAKAEQDKLIVEAEKVEKSNLLAFKDAQAKLNETLKQIEAVRDATPKFDPSKPSAPASSNAVVAYASNFLGTPYKWGGTTPAGFDCSGFAQYVYKHFGIYIGRTTKDQIHDGVEVYRDNLRPGDLVFYGRGGIPSHVGIYIGNGMYIHSPRTGDVIKISSYDRSDYITARRVMK